MAKADITRATQFIGSIDLDRVENYKRYWQSLQPQDYFQVFERWMFAFCSVHTTWESNLKGYTSIKNWLPWYDKPELLKEKLIESGAGMHNVRTTYIAEFCKRFWSNPTFYYKQANETWLEYRDRLVSNILGLGKAKVSFGIELIYPCESGVVCLDTHMFELYRLNQAKDLKHYIEIEKHWVDHSLQRNIPPVIARALYWDNKQQKTDSRYWTYVFENLTAPSYNGSTAAS